MSAIGPGDWVECVDAAPEGDIWTRLTQGNLYLVEAILPPRRLIYRDIGESVLLVGVRHPGNPLGVYNPSRFRPIYRPSADLINSLKQPIQAEFLDEAAQVLTPSLG